ncbi:MAG: hypothetical protein AB1586_11765 [Pseudomonadota bacterium]
MPIKLNTPWRAMIAVNIAMVVALFVYKLALSYPDLPYTQLLSDYHFGFAKRSLVGALVGLAFPVLPSSATYVVGAIPWLITTALFLRLFRTTFGTSEATLPLLVFTAGSPFFLKNFVQTLGYYDIYGVLLAIVLLLVPARSVLYVLAAAAGSVALLLIHQLHLLLTIPTIGAIVILRHHLPRGFRTADLALAVVLTLAVAAVFVLVQFHGAPQVAPEVFEAHLRARMADPSETGIMPGIFYRSSADELRDTWQFMARNLRRVPIYLVLIALHAPLIRTFRDHVRGLAEPMHRRVVATLTALVSVGYLVIFLTVFDYSRWVSSFGSCMILLLHAVRQLPAAREAAPIDGTNRWVRACGWAVTLIPRVGTVTPF